ncbi:MAG: glycerol kinase GlpK [Candidatus Omnitrophica bacterium]|nr:glycerol kinase GlpK [Candidatus Omnitrophota bacterium]
MEKKYILALDQGTTGSRAFIFDEKGRVVSSAYQEFKQYYPHPGWVEHDAQEIWASCRSVLRQSIQKSKINPANIVGLGITNQRETAVLWDRTTTRPLAKAIVWQCRRTAPICENLKDQGLEKIVKQKTGLVIDPYFSATKIKWSMDYLRGIKQKMTQGKVCFGNIDSWLIWNLTKGQAHVTDMTNASRTLLFNIHQYRWDSDLLKIFGVPEKILPEVKKSGGLFGTVQDGTLGVKIGTPILSVLGDQQAALYGQGCFKAGSIKNTYGTGCFLVLNTGKKPVRSKNGLLTTIVSDLHGNPMYALEGAVFISGAVMQWLRDEIKILPSARDSEKIAMSLHENEGVYFVPAFTGLGAPYWDPHARGMIYGLTRGTQRQHIIRAALESVAYQTKDVFDLMQKESGTKVNMLKVDGGAVTNNFLMQFQSDILRKQIVRPKMIDTTVQGAAHLAGVKAGLWSSRRELDLLRKVDRSFSPQLTPSLAKKYYQGWLQAVKKVKTK